MQIFIVFITGYGSSEKVIGESMFLFTSIQNILKLAIL
jgi:hypothetical protein